MSQLHLWFKAEVANCIACGPELSPPIHFFAVCGCFALQQQSSVVVTQTLQTAKLKIPTLGPLQKEKKKSAGLALKY